LKENGGFVGDLSKMLLCSGDNTYRISAAETLQHLCIHYEENDEYFKTLMQAMKDVTIKVISSIITLGFFCKSICPSPN
jgi:hypothetical protein